MESKLTPELSVALDRAMTAAGTDPLVEALDAMQSFLDEFDAEDCGSGRGKLAESYDRTRAILAKYRPVSESDTQNC